MDSSLAYVVCCFTFQALSALLFIWRKVLLITICYNMNCERFVLFRLPMPRPGQVLGLVGTNGIGKSTALKILAGKQKPNLGRFTVS